MQALQEVSADTSLQEGGAGEAYYGSAEMEVLAPHLTSSDTTPVGVLQHLVTDF